VKSTEESLVVGTAPPGFAADGANRLTIDPVAMQACFGQELSARAYGAIGLLKATWKIPDAGSDFVTLHGADKWPTAPIAAEALIGIPDEAIVATAIGFTGRDLATYLTARSGESLVNVLQRGYDRAYRERLGQLADLVENLDGTVVLAMVPQPIIPGFLVTTPRGQSWDALALALRDYLDMSAVSDHQDLWQCPPQNKSLPVAWRLQRTERRWILTSAADAEYPDRAPSWAAEWPGHHLASRIATKQCAAVMAGFTALLVQAGGTGGQQGYSSLKSACMRVAASDLADAYALGDPDANARDLVLKGSLAPLSVVPLALAGDKVMEAIYGHAIRPLASNLETDLAQAARMPQPRYLMGRKDAPWLKDGIWAATVPLLDEIPGVPVAVSNPETLLGQATWADREGRVHCVRGAAAKELWSTAVRLVEAGAGARVSDWAEAMAMVRRQRLGEALSFRNDENVSILALPRQWIEIPKSKRPNWEHDALWRRGGVNLGILAEAGNTTEAGAQAVIEENVMANFSTVGEVRQLHRKACAADGVPAVRVGFEVRVGMSRERVEMVLIQHQGWVVQLIASGPVAKQADIQHGLDVLLERFAFIDRNRPSPALEELREVPTATAAELPVEVDLVGSGWMVRPEPNRAQEFAALALVHPRTGAYSFLLAGDMEGRTASLAGLMAGLLDLVGAKDPDRDATAARPCTLAGTPALEAVTDLGEGVGRLRLRCAQIAGNAVLFATWSGSSSGIDPALHEGLVGRLRPRSEGEATPSVRTTGEFAATLAGYFVRRELWGDALPWVTAAMARLPGNHAVIERGLTVLNRLDRPAEGLAWYRAHAEALAHDDLALASWEPWFLAQTGEKAAAIAAYVKLFDRGYASDEDFAECVRLLRASSRNDEADGAFARWKVGGSPASRMLRLRLLHEDGKDQDAQTLLQAEFAASAQDELARVALAEGLLTIGHHTEAQRELCEALRTRPGLQSAWRQRGIAESRLGWHKDALVSLQRAIVLDPTDASAREWLDSVRQTLGRGDASLLRHVIAPVAPELGGEPASVNEGTGTRWLLREHRVAWTSTGDVLHTQRRVLVLVDAAACEEMATLDLPFDPEREDIAINALTVAPPEAAAIDRHRPDDCYVVDDPDAMGDGSGRLARIPVAGLVPGCVLDWTVTYRQRRVERPWLRITLASGWPVQRSQVMLVGPDRGLEMRAGPGVSIVREDDGVLRAIVAKRDGERGRVLTNPWGTDLPTVLIGTPEGTWQALGQAHLTEIAERLAPDSEVLAAGRALRPIGVDDATTCAAVLGFVSKTVAYRAVLFGRGGMLPRRPGEVLERKQGDCKDHAALVQALLSGAGVKAHLALVNTDWPIDPGLPSLEQFNHMVTVVEEVDGSQRVLDATADHMDPTLPVPPGLGGAHLLVLDPAGPRLVTAPNHRPSVISSERRIEADAAGSLRVREQVLVSGYLAGSVRGRLSSAAPGDREAAMLNILGDAAESVEQVSILEGEQADPLRLDLAWIPRIRMERNDNVRRGVLSEPWAEWMLRVDPEPERTRALSVRYPFSITSRTTVEGSGGLRRQVGKASPETDNEFFSFAEQGEPGSRSITIQQRVGTWPAARFAEWQKRAAELCRRAEVTLEMPVNAGQ
jgi:tetratricopeptide (TPR) repeat protein